MFIYELSSGGTRWTGGAKQLSSLWVTRDVATMAWKVKLAVGFAFWLVSCVTGVWSDRDYSLSTTHSLSSPHDCTRSSTSWMSNVDCPLQLISFNISKKIYIFGNYHIFGICHHHFGLMDGVLIGQWVSNIIDISGSMGQSSEAEWLNWMSQLTNNLSSISYLKTDKLFII